MNAEALREEIRATMPPTNGANAQDEERREGEFAQLVWNELIVRLQVRESKGLKMRSYKLREHHITAPATFKIITRRVFAANSQYLF